METLCALIRGDLAPVGNKISLMTDLDAFAYSLAGYEASWVDSGTSALALALADAKQKAPHIKNPQVIIPGYCCPDLVAAAVYAGVRPLVVDIDKADASYDLAELSAAINQDTIAIIAVNFLGVKERLADIRTLLQNTPIKLIEDNAQWFPASANEQDFLSDYVVFTFGRGKPLSLLGGGVLFAREPLLVADWVKPPAEDSAYDFKQHGKLMAYNLLLSPHRYCYLNRAPFLRLGETRYHELREILGLDSYRKSLFAANLLLHVSRSRRVEEAYDEICATVGLQQLLSLATDRRQRLLRYPLLFINAQDRDIALQKLTAAGLGASPMYQRAITEIPEVEQYIDVVGDLKNARHFACRFLTLPTHEYVSAKHIRRIGDLLGK